MSPHQSLQIFLLLLIQVNSQFEFENLQAVHDIAISAVDEVKFRCIAILRPNFENTREKSAIDRLTYGLAKNYYSRNGEGPASVMSYDTKSYRKFYMDIRVRVKDTCSFWITIVMANNSTKSQINYVSFYVK